MEQTLDDIFINFVDNEPKLSVFYDIYIRRSQEQQNMFYEFLEGWIGEFKEFTFFYGDYYLNLYIKALNYIKLRRFLDENQ